MCRWQGGKVRKRELGGIYKAHGSIPVRIDSASSFPNLARLRVGHRFPLEAGSSQIYWSVCLPLPAAFAPVLAGLKRYPSPHHSHQNPPQPLRTLGTHCVRKHCINKPKTGAHNQTNTHAGYERLCSIMYNQRQRQLPPRLDTADQSEQTLSVCASDTASRYEKSLESRLSSTSEHLNLECVVERWSTMLKVGCAGGNQGGTTNWKSVALGVNGSKIRCCPWEILSTALLKLKKRSVYQDDPAPLQLLNVLRGGFLWSGQMLCSMLPWCFPGRVLSFLA
jgi:hypothetical protein